MAERFPIRFTGANRAMVAIGLLPSRCWVEVAPETLHVQMSWSFAATVPRTSVRSAATDDRKAAGWGVHGWRGSWLVNGSSSGIVRIELEPVQRARLLCWRVHVRVLRVAVEDPDGLERALAGATG